MGRSDHSKKLSWLLRHGAAEAGLEMDEAGWASIADVLAILDLSRDQLTDVVEHNTKRRLVIDGDRIRACQGHSAAGMPVTREALEASWTVSEVRRAWHTTFPDKVASILTNGLSPMGRTHVHLAPSRDSGVGKRVAPVLLEVDLDTVRGEGLAVFAADNGVILVRRVPPEALLERD